MEQVVTFFAANNFAFESTLLLTSFVTLASFLMVKRAKKTKKMDDFGAACFSKKVYYICFRQGKTEDSSKPFEAPVVAAYVGFEDEKGINFQGLQSATQWNSLLYNYEKFDRQKEA